MELKIIRRPEVLKTIACSNTTMWVRIQDGLFPKPFSIGGTRVGWTNREVNQIMIANIKGYSDDKIKELVKSMYVKRQELEDLF